MARRHASSQTELSEHVYDQEIDRDSHAIEALISRIRRALGGDVIETRRGYGYPLQTCHQSLFFVRFRRLAIADILHGVLLEF